MMKLDETAKGNQDQEKDVSGEGESGPEQMANPHAISYSMKPCPQIEQSVIAQPVSEATLVTPPLVPARRSDKLFHFNDVGA